MGWTVVGAGLGAAVGSFAGGPSIMGAALIGSTVGGILDALTKKAPRVHKDRYWAGPEYGTPINRLWGAGRLDCVPIWVQRNGDGSFITTRSVGGSKKKGTPGIDHGFAYYAVSVAQSGFTFANGDQVERAITLDRIRMADQIVWASDTAVAIQQWSSTTTYNFGDQVQKGAVYYSSKADVNLNHDPGVTNSDWWLKISEPKYNIHIQQHPDPTSGESTFTMAADSRMVSHDGISNTPAYRELTFFTVLNQDLYKLGNTLPSNISVECHTAALTDGDFLSDCARFAGLLPSEFDFSNLTTPLAGICQREQMSVQDLVTTFCLVRAYDLTEIDGKVRAVVRGGAVTRTIADNDLGAADGASWDAGNTPIPYDLTSDRRDLHSHLILKYVSQAQFYRTVTIIAVREDAQNYNPVTIDTGMVLGDNEAAQIANRILDTEWLEGGNEYGPIDLPREYADVAPGDVIQLNLDGMPTRFRVSESTFARQHTLTIVRDEAEVLNQYATGDSGSASGGNNTILSNAYVVASPAIDLTDAYSAFPGFYVWANNASGSVDAEIYYSFDDFATSPIDGGRIVAASAFGPVVSIGTTSAGAGTLHLARKVLTEPSGAFDPSVLSNVSKRKTSGTRFGAGGGTSTTSAGGTSSAPGSSSSPGTSSGVGSSSSPGTSSGTGTSSGGTSSGLGTSSVAATGQFAFRPVIHAQMVVAPSTVPLVLGGAQVGLVGNEWIGIVNAGAPGDIQPLGGPPEPGLVRGIHGSPQDGHIVGELFAMAPDTPSTKKVQVDKSYIGRTVYVRVLSDGQDINDAQSVTCVIASPTPPYSPPSTPFQEVPGGTVTGSNFTFTLTHTPVAGTLILTLNGLRQIEGTDFTISGMTITMTVAPSAGPPIAQLYASYRA